MATFSDTAATHLGPTAYIANINWGDGHITNGLIATNSRGGFNVIGTNTFASAGRVPISVDVEKFDATGTSISLTNTALVAAASDHDDAHRLLDDAPRSASRVTLTAGSRRFPGTSRAGRRVRGWGEHHRDGHPATTPGTATFTTSTLMAGHAQLRSRPSTGQLQLRRQHLVLADGDNRLEHHVAVLKVTLSKVRKKGNNKFHQTVVLHNTGGNTLPGPVFFVLGNLNPKVKLINQTGMTNLIPPSPYLTIPAGCLRIRSHPGRAVILSLTFTANYAKKIVYSSLLVGGVTQP